MAMVLICIGVWVIASVLVSMFFLSARELDKEICIETRYLDFKNSKVLDHTPTLIEELNKVEEEKREFINGVLKGDTLNAIEEYYDTKQSMENSLQLMGVSKMELIEGQYKHYSKLKNRGWIFK